MKLVGSCRTQFNSITVRETITAITTESIFTTKRKYPSLIRQFAMMDGLTMYENQTVLFANNP